MFKLKSKIFYIFLFLSSFFAALFAIHIRTKTTILGYEIGSLKSEEAQLLINNSLLNMELSKITTKKWLMNFINQNKDDKNANEHALTKQKESKL